MKKSRKRFFNFILSLILLLCLFTTSSNAALVVRAVTQEQVDKKSEEIDGKKNQIDDTQNKLDGLNDKVDSLLDEQDLIDEQLEDLTSELMNTMTAIGLKEDEIKETQSEIKQKEKDIEATSEAYDDAVQREQKQHDDMIIRIRAMYENGETDMLSLIMQGKGLSDILNRLDFVDSIYSYDRMKMEEYTQTRKDVKDLWDLLETEKQELEKTESSLEADREELKIAEAELSSLKKKVQAQFDDYEARIKKAKNEAAVAKKLLQQEQKELKALEKEKKDLEKKKKEEEDAAKKPKPDPASGTTPSEPSTPSTPSDGGSGSGYDSVIDSASGSETGKAIAKYACRFIGNPYVAGGTSLTNGADCSGFTYRIYADHGYSIPRTSFQQRSCGTGVSYADAQPGDLICYDGHVAMYIGGGKIVHASTARTGIKISNANYRTILAVRRVV